MKKYEFTGETKTFLGRELRRIKALASFSDVAAGEIGGWIENESNLSQTGEAWVYGNALVYDNAQVYGNAWVYGNARVYDNAQVYGNARVCGNARVYGNARVCGNARVYSDARVCGNARVFGDALVFWVSKIGSRLGTTTFFKSKPGVEVSCGCFSGTLEQFEAKVNETHGNDKYGEEYRLAIELAKLKLIGVGDE